MNTNGKRWLGKLLQYNSYFFINDPNNSKKRMVNLEEILATKKMCFSTVVNVSPCLDLYLDVQPKNINSFQEYHFCSASNWKQVNTEMMEEGIRDEDTTIHFGARGGILADEMGLGKTVTLISLIHSHPRKLNEDTQAYHPIFDKEIETIEYIKTTLVVCPSQKVSQWGKEIENASNLTYKCCNTYRQYSTRELGDYDVVIVSHSAFFEKNGTCKKQFLQYGWYLQPFIIPQTQPLTLNHSQVSNNTG